MRLEVTLHFFNLHLDQLHLKASYASIVETNFPKLVMISQLFTLNIPWYFLDFACDLVHIVNYIKIKMVYTDKQKSLFIFERKSITISKTMMLLSQ